jgi:hypothetical protein
MPLNCCRCEALPLDYVNSASSLDLHRFNWLSNDAEIGALPMERWNHLVDAQNPETAERSTLLHWTLGCLCFRE